MTTYEAEDLAALAAILEDEKMTTITLDAARCSSLLEAEEALHEYIPEGGLPRAQALFDLFAEAHALLIAEQRVEHAGPVEPLPSYPITSRRAPR